MADEDNTQRARRALGEQPTHEPDDAPFAGQRSYPLDEPTRAAEPVAEPVPEPEPVVVKARDGSSVVAKRSAGRSRGLSWRLVLGAVLVAFGLSMLGWIGWQYFGTNITSNQAMAQERTQLREGWQAPSTQSSPAGSKPVAGDAIALIRIPKLGADYEYPIIAGTEDEQLARGVGWYTATAQPGQVGNFAVAGHRITHGEPFARLLELDKGDKVVVETRTAVYTYELTTSPRDLTVKDDEGGWVLWPVPDQKQPGAKPTEAILTLTTCTDLFASPQRSVAFGKLVETKNK